MPSAHDICCQNSHSSCGYLIPSFKLVIYCEVLGKLCDWEVLALENYDQPQLIGLVFEIVEMVLGVLLGLSADITFHSILVYIHRLDFI